MAKININNTLNTKSLCVNYSITSRREPKTAMLGGGTKDQTSIHSRQEQQG
jgi:hypothetical protein